MGEKKGLFAQETAGVPDPDPTEPTAEHPVPHLGPLVTQHSPSRCRLWGSPAEGSGSRSWGSSEVQALACLPSPSHRKSSSLAQTSPGAAPGACCGEKTPVGAQLLLPQLDRQPCSPAECPYSLYCQTTPQLLNPKSIPYTSPLYPISCPLPNTLLP